MSGLEEGIHENPEKLKRVITAPLQNGEEAFDGVDHEGTPRYKMTTKVQKRDDGTDMTITRCVLRVWTHSLTKLVDEG